MGPRLRRRSTRPFWAPLAVAAVWILLFLVAGCASTRTLRRDPGPGIVWGETHVSIGAGPGGVTLDLVVPRRNTESLPTDGSPSLAGRSVQQVDGWPTVR